MTIQKSFLIPLFAITLSLNSQTKLVKQDGEPYLFSPIGTQIADSSNGAAQGDESARWQEGAPFLLTFPESPDNPITFRSLPEFYTTFTDAPDQTALEQLQNHLKKHPYVAVKRPDNLIVVGKHYDVQDCTDISKCTFLTALSEEDSCPTSDESCAKTPAHHVYVPFLGEHNIHITPEEPS